MILAASILVSSSHALAEPPTVAECVKDAKAIIRAADLVIDLQEKQISARDALIKDVIQQNDSLAVETQKMRDSVGAWYRNPWFLIGAGLLVGVAVTK